MRSLTRDFILAMRGFRKRPGLFTLAVITLALGIGLTSAMFGVAHGLLLNGLPFEGGDRILAIVRNRPSLGTFLQTVPIRDYDEWKKRQTSFQELGAFTIATFNVSGDGRPERLFGSAMTASAFRLIREPPLMGRVFTEADEIVGAPRVVVISHALWRDRFDEDPGVIGKTLRVDGHVSWIIGVMDEGFEFPAVQRLWIPLRLDPSSAAPDEGQLRVFGRLADAVTPAKARADFTAIAAILAAESPQSHEGITISIRPYVEQFIGPAGRPLLFLMLGAVSFVLLIACSNVANLLLARAVARNREVAIRTALGASRRRIIASHMMEASLLVLLGGLGGFIVAQLGIAAFYESIVTLARPFWLTADVAPEVLLFVAFLLLVSTILSGALPSMRASKNDVAQVLKDEARGSSGLKLGRLSRMLVVGEIAVSCALLIGAGLMVKSLANFSAFDIGFTTENIFTTTITAGDGDFETDELQVQFFEDLERRVSAIPGVVAAGIVSELPVIGAAQAPYEIEGTSAAGGQERPLTRVIATTPGMFETFEISVLEGRGFNATDRESTVSIALVNESFVQREFSGESALGRRLRIHAPTSGSEWLTVVGVVPDMHLEQEYSFAAPPAVYVPMRQQNAVTGTAGFFAMNLVARTATDPLAITPQVRDAVSGLNPNIPISQQNTFEGAMAQVFAGAVAIGGSFAIFGLVAVFLAAVGLYGVMSFSTNQRTKELGIRMAFGARRRDAFVLVLKDAGRQVGVGLGVGLLLGLGLSNTLQFALFRVEPVQPGIMLGVLLFLAAVALTATLIPASRASRVDPMVAIRYE